MSELLKGFRVIESAQLLNGDTLGMLLGDLGADVIKIESPFRGDYMRYMLGQLTPENSAPHLQANKNKRSVALDLRDARGREVFWRLFDTADAFIDGNVAGTTDKLGIGFQAQRARKPSIVYCHYSGYGWDSPYSRVPTHGQMTNALAASMPREMGPDGLVHAVTGDLSYGGMRSGGEGTMAGAMHAALHVAGALARQVKSGEGAFIDVSGADAVVMQAWLVAMYRLNAHRVTDMSTMPALEKGEHIGAKYQFYETKDGHLVLFAGIEHKFWDRFCEVVGRPDLVDNKDESSPVDYAPGQVPLRLDLQAIFHTKTLDEWMEVAVAHDIPIGPAPQRVEDLPGSPHFRRRAVFVEGEHPVAGPFTYVGEAAVVDGRPYEVRHPAPALGENTRAILAELGIDANEIEKLTADDVI